MPSHLFSLKLTFDRSKLESLRDVSLTRIGDIFPTVFHRLSLGGILSKEAEVLVPSLSMNFLILLPVASFKKISGSPEKCGIL